MKITTPDLKEIKAAFSVKFGGYTVSVSNTMDSWGNVCVFDAEENVVKDFRDATGENLLRALQHAKRLASASTTWRRY